MYYTDSIASDIKHAILSKPGRNLIQLIVEDHFATINKVARINLNQTEHLLIDKIIGLPFLSKNPAKNCFLYINNLKDSKNILPSPEKETAAYILCADKKTLQYIGGAHLNKPSSKDFILTDEQINQIFNAIKIDIQTVTLNMVLSRVEYLSVCYIIGLSDQVEKCESSIREQYDRVKTIFNQTSTTERDQVKNPFVVAMNDKMLDKVINSIIDTYLFPDIVTSFGREAQLIFLPDNTPNYLGFTNEDNSPGVQHEEPVYPSGSVDFGNDFILYKEKEQKNSLFKAIAYQLKRINYDGELGALEELDELVNVLRKKAIEYLSTHQSGHEASSEIPGYLKAIENGDVLEGKWALQALASVLQVYFIVKKHMNKKNSTIENEVYGTEGHSTIILWNNGSTYYGSLIPKQATINPSNSEMDVHAELKIIDYLFDQETLKKEQKSSNYIGISLPCCSLCQFAIDAVNEVYGENTIATRGSEHNQINPAGIPRFLKENKNEIRSVFLRYFLGRQEYKKQSINVDGKKLLLDEAIEDHPEEALKFIFSTRTTIKKDTLSQLSESPTSLLSSIELLAEQRQQLIIRCAAEGTGQLAFNASTISRERWRLKLPATSYFPEHHSAKESETTEPGPTEEDAQVKNAASKWTKNEN